MAWFTKKADPISDRARVLNDEIAALEAEIKTLDAQLQRQNSQPRLRPTAIPRGAQNHEASPEASTARQPAPEPIFEDVDRDSLKSQTEAASTPEHYNELGVRKYDLPALFRRIRNHFRGP